MRGPYTGPPETMAGRGDAWTPQLEAMARSAMLRANALAWIYGHMVASAKTGGTVLSIVSGVFAGLVGAEGIIDLASSGPDENGCVEAAPEWARVAAVVVSFLVVVAVAVGNTWKTDAAVTEGRAAQVKFGHIGHAIALELAARPPLRQEAQAFVRETLVDLERVMSTAPTVDRGARAAYDAAHPHSVAFESAPSAEQVAVEAFLLSL